MAGTIKERGPNKWVIIIDLGKKPNGKRNQKWITFTGTKTQAKKELSRIETEYDQGLYIDPSKDTVEKYLNDWLDVVKPILELKTWVRYEEIIKLHLIPALGHHQIQKLNPLHIEKYYNYARTSGRIDGKGGLSERTLLHHHRLLSTALERAAKFKFISTNPCSIVTAPKPKKTEVSVINEIQTAKMLDAAMQYNPKLYATICVTVLTGLRLGEVLGLKWSDIDLDRMELCVNRTVQRIKKIGLVIKPIPKTVSSRRTVALPATVVTALKNHLDEQNLLRKHAGEYWQDDDFVFPNEDGTVRGPDSVSHQFRNLAKKAGFNINFHGLRHSHATHLLRANVQPKLASERLGHSTIKITMDLYQHVLPDSKHEVAAAIDHVMKSAINGAKQTKRADT